MRVTVRTYDDESKSNRFELEVAMTYKVERVKKEIEKFCGIPSCKQLLFYDGLQLEDGNSVEDYGLKNGPTILLVFNPAGINTSFCPLKSCGQTLALLSV